MTAITFTHENLGVYRLSHSLSGIEHEHEYRFAEYEYERCAEPGPSRDARFARRAIVCVPLDTSLPAALCAILVADTTVEAELRG